MSNEKPGENPGRRNPKVSRGRFVRPGLAGPKPRPKGAGDGRQVNIPELPARARPTGGPEGQAGVQMDASLAARGARQANPPRTRLSAATSGGSAPRKPPNPRRPEKPLGTGPGTVPKPTQVGGYQSTKARERNLVKELGNLAP